jgi:hypothetical protein
MENEILTLRLNKDFNSSIDDYVEALVRAQV